MWISAMWARSRASCTATSGLPLYPCKQTLNIPRSRSPARWESTRQQQAETPHGGCNGWTWSGARTGWMSRLHVDDNQIMRVPSCSLVLWLLLGT